MTDNPTQRSFKFVYKPLISIDSESAKFCNEGDYGFLVFGVAQLWGGGRTFFGNLGIRCLREVLVRSMLRNKNGHSMSIL